MIGTAVDIENKINYEKEIDGRERWREIIR